MHAAASCTEENWIEWEELNQARRIEAFRFLETAADLQLTSPPPAGSTGGPKATCPRGRMRAGTAPAGAFPRA